VLLAAFMFFYVSAACSKSARTRLLDRSQSAALSDALTSLGNRRALYEAPGSTDAVGPRAAADGRHCSARTGSSTTKGIVRLASAS